MKKYIAGMALLALILVTTAVAGSGDQGRRLAGPFCVGKPNLAPVWIGNKKVSRAGVVRSISVREACQKTEVRRFGKTVPDIDPTAPTSNVPGPAGPAGPAGKDGKDGKDGATGATGPAGQNGADGKDGSDEDAGGLWICADGNSGHGTALGGTGSEPDCNNGTKVAYQVEYTQMRTFEHGNG